jgi:hypothetical protein
MTAPHTSIRSRQHPRRNCARLGTSASRPREPKVGPDQRRGSHDLDPSSHFTNLIYEPESIPKSHDIGDSIPTFVLRRLQYQQRGLTPSLGCRRRKAAQFANADALSTVPLRRGKAG